MKIKMKLDKIVEKILKNIKIILFKLFANLQITKNLSNIFFFIFQ